MKKLHNIEKSTFGHYPYVGYGLGEVWHIERNNLAGWKWCAVQQNGTRTIRTNTLTELSIVLEG